MGNLESIPPDFPFSFFSQLSFTNQKGLQMTIPEGDAKLSPQIAQSNHLFSILFPLLLDLVIHILRYYAQ